MHNTLSELLTDYSTELWLLAVGALQYRHIQNQLHPRMVTAYTMHNKTI